MEFQKIKAVLFDLDGTLLDTLAGLGTSANFALCRFGFSTYPIPAYRQMIGHGVRNLFRSALQEPPTEELLDQLLKVQRGYYLEHCTELENYYPGVQAFLRDLQARGLKLAVITNKDDPAAQKMIAHYFPEIDWAFVWGADGVRPLKPNTEAGILACETLGVKPEEVVFVGDGDTDMAFASAMGFTAAGCTWGYRSREQLQAAGAYFLCDSYDQLRETFGI